MLRRIDLWACRGGGLLVTLACLMVGASARAATFTLTPEDDWAVLESAQAGDVVEVAPGTYQFRVYLSQVGTAEQPIVIRAQDPNNRPVWDLEGGGPESFVDKWPGSYTGGDNHRGCWQIAAEGAFYEISGIVFQNCRAPSSAALRLINSGPVTLRDCLFQHSTNGLTGASTDLVVEHSEFFDNGKRLTGGNATHHIYIFGGKFSLRYSYLHDGYDGQAFHVRARESVIEYNWIARPANYVGDIMSCERFCGEAPHVQRMLLRGNVIVQGMPSNGSQLFALFRDAEPDMAAEMELSLVHNTIIGTPRTGGHHLVNMRNDTVLTTVNLFNNIVHGVASLGTVAEPSGSHGITGGGNWVSEGTAILDGVERTTIGLDPGFVDLEGELFGLTNDAEARGIAQARRDAPEQEYYRDEQQPLRRRARPSANDPGAFESGNTTEAVDAYGATDTAAEGAADEDPGSAGVPASDDVPETGAPTPSERVRDQEERPDSGGRPVSLTEASSSSCDCRVASRTRWGWGAWTLALGTLGVCAFRRRLVRRRV